MHAVTTFSHSVFRTLRHSLQSCFPRLLHAAPDNVNQALLDQTEILDLRLRIAARLHKPATNRFDTAHQRMGDARSIHRGYGLDYEESRPYQAGDDPRYMNWALTARSGELYMKVYREERRPGVFILVDRRASMRFGTRVRLKVAQAARVATCIGFAALQRHATVGGVILDSATQAPQWIKANGDEHDAFALIHAASAACPPNNNMQTSSNNEPRFTDVLNMLQALITPGTQVYLISDFSDLGEQHRGQLLHLATENPLHAIHISDPAEQHLPKLGMAHFRALNADSDMLLDTDSATLQTDYDMLAKNHVATRQQLFRSLGISYTPISTLDEDIETPLAEL